MSQSVIHLSSEPIGQGRERSCFLHPEDDSKIIKVSNGRENVQSQREIDFYSRLLKREDFPYSHIPRYYGMVQTNRGQGIVVDLVRDFDGNISRSMHEYLTEGIPLQEFADEMNTLKRYFLEHRIIFNHDLVPGNLLRQRLSSDDSRLVAIDGLGDVVIVQWLNYFPGHARAKINRRWDRLQQRLDQSWGHRQDQLCP